MNKVSRRISVLGLGDVKVAASDTSTFKSAVQLLAGDAYLDHTAPAKGLRPGDIIVAIAEQRVVGAIASQVAPGRVGWIWPPVIDRFAADPSATTRVSRELVAAAVAQLAEAHCKLAQALLPSGEPRARDFEANGFVRITEMIRMDRDCNSRPNSTQDAGGLEFVAFGPATERVFEEVIEQTYSGSLDCPELDAFRSVSDVLLSYKGTDSFRPELWLLARRGGTWLGCVLLACFSDENRCELQYMGVVPAARGKQLGRTLCARALLEAHRVGACKLSLSVDSRNVPAIKQYMAMGFVEIERREVYVRRLPPAAGGG
jgi:ribosomal protein S18 acetylase RimI-like enzyme